MFDTDQLAAIGMMTWDSRDADGLAAQRVGNEDALSLDSRDAVAEMADMIDEEAFNHGERR